MPKTDTIPEKITAGTFAIRYGFPAGDGRIVRKRYGLDDMRTEAEWHEELNGKYTYQREFVPVKPAKEHGN